MGAPPEEAFTNKSVWYDKYRPEYPDAIIQSIAAAYPQGATIADIGAGTGYLALPLARRGFRVVAIDPNAELLAVLAGKVTCEPHLQIETLDGKAQSTGLGDASVDGVVMGNVAHWLDRNSSVLARSVTELRRISKPAGRASVAFTHPAMRNRWIGEVFDLAAKSDPMFDPAQISATFTDPTHHARAFLEHVESRTQIAFHRLLDCGGFIEFMCSHSFCDMDMRAELTDIFSRHASAGKIRVDFDSLNYNGILHATPAPSTPPFPVAGL